jgi:hypothetical protein
MVELRRAFSRLNTARGDTTSWRSALIKQAHRESGIPQPSRARQAGESRANNANGTDSMFHELDAQNAKLADAQHSFL